MLKKVTENIDMADEDKTVKVRINSIHKDGKNTLSTKGVQLQAKGLTIKTHAGGTVLSDISFHIKPGELVLLAGPSNSGKATLLRSLAGLMKPTGGDIYIDGVNLYPNVKAFSSSIGFVPAEYALQKDLTVTETLQDAARLLLPHSMTAIDREQRLLALLRTTGLDSVADYRVGLLSNVEKRKLSIAIELIDYPGLLLIDGSAESLTPSEEVQITSMLKDLSHQGLTIIHVDDLTRNTGLADKVIFLAPGGILAWFGPVDEGFSYLRSLIPAGTAKNMFGLEDALEILVNPHSGAGTEWAKRFKAQPAYRKYVDDPLNGKHTNLMEQSQPLMRLRSNSKEKLAPTRVARANGAETLFLLIQRNLRLLWRGKTWLLLLAIPPLAALVDFVLSSPTMLDPLKGDPDRTPIVLGIIVFLDLLIAALLVQNEILKDKAVYQREHRTNSLSLPYILSKLWLVGILALYQAMVWTIIHFAATRFYGGLQIFPLYGITLFLVAFVGGVLGLIASAISRTATMSAGFVLLLTLPQLFLSGSILPLPHLNFPVNLLSGTDPSRYAFETLLTLSGYGYDVANDPCWKIPADQRNSMTDEQKNGCTCMGINVFSRCNFPGIQASYSFVIEQPMPAQPTASSAINSIPVQPLLKQGETADQFSAEVNTYTSQMESYQANYDAFVTSVRQYADSLANWQRLRSIAIGHAEGIIAEALDHYGQGFNVDVLGHWSVLAIMSLFLMILLFGIQQTTDRVKK